MVNKVEFSAKNLTSNAGLFLLFEYCKNNEIFDLISHDLVFDKDSTNKIKMNHIKTLMCGFFAGANKLERLKLLQSDPLIKEFDIQVREPETISRFAGEFSFKTTQMLRQINFKIFKKIIRKCKIKSIIIDIDSTVINVWGVQEGTAKGYNPVRKGNRCYNDILAFCDELKCYITGFMRSGNTYTANGTKELIAEIIENLKELGLDITFRMDSGYFDEDIIKVIEESNYKYVIKAKGYSTLIKKLLAADCEWKCTEDKEVAEITTKPDNWERERRFVIARRLKPINERMQLSFDVNNEYEYAFYTTNTADEAVNVAISYEKRGNSENYIKEAKYDMNVGSILLKSFWANEAIFQLSMLCYNVFLLFKTDNTSPKEYRQQIKTFRLKYIFVAAKIIKTARQVVMKICNDYPYKEVYARCII